MTGIVDAQTWSEETFGNCDLGDVRRNKRLMKVAQRVIENPAGSFPEQMPDWAELKAAYRLFDSEDVTLSAITDPHRRQTQRAASGKTLIICDTTELDFRSEREGLRPTGNGSGRGFLLHNAMMVDADSRSVSGIAGHALHYRPARKVRKQNSSQILKRDRESQVWGQVIDEVGTPGPEAQYVYVCDRGADNFEVFCHLTGAQSDWVIRAKKQKRNVLTPDGETISLPDLLTQMDFLGTYELTLRSRSQHPGRVANIEVSSISVLIPVPHHKSPWVKSLDPAPIRTNLIRVREIAADDDVEPIEWLLWTSLPAKTFAQAWTVIEDYESRWLIEEFHKALKSGCRVTSRQLQTASRLEPVVGLLLVVAIRLLQLKTAAQSTPDRPARTMVPRLWLAMLKAARGRRLRRVHDLTIQEFYREIAKLGGFLGRKSDGQPGWITIWRGWDKLATLVQGANLAKNIKIETMICG